MGTFCENFRLHATWPWRSDNVTECRTILSGSGTQRTTIILCNLWHAVCRQRKKERKNFVRSEASPARNEMADHERIPFDLSFKIPPVGTHLARTQDGILLNLPSRVSPRGTKPKFRCLNSRNPDHKLLSRASPIGIQTP